MSEISGHDPDFKYIIALNRLMTWFFFLLNSENLAFRDNVGRAKPNGVRERTAERGGERESDENASSYAERHRCVAVLFFLRVPVSFAFILLLLSSTVEL